MSYEHIEETIRYTGFDFIGKKIETSFGLVIILL